MSFFDKHYQTPDWLKHKLKRRQLLKSAAGATAIAAMPRIVWAEQQHPVQDLLTAEPWRTFNHVLVHLLPESDSGPGATSIQALEYLYNVVNLQPIDVEEKQFILKGVEWLNSYSQSQLQQDFYQLTTAKKETILKAISGSQSGHNWLNTLINYLYEAMLTPPIYGGNPDGIGWQWLEHKPGFPLPEKGYRYYELPGSQQIAVKNLLTEDKTKS